MSKIPKAIAVLGIVAGLGAAMVPLCSCRAATTDTKKSDLNVEVLGTLSITVTNVKDSTDFDPDTSTLDLGDVIVNGPVAQKSLDVVISSNGPRKVNLSIRDSDSEPGLVNAEKNYVLPAVAGAALAQGGAGWGYKVGTGDWAKVETTDVTIVSGGVTGQGYTGDPQVTGKNDELHTTVTFGAVTNTSVPEGIYTGGVIFTATPAS